MTLKLLRAAWFLSVVALLAGLLLAYAGWHDEVVVIAGTGGEQISIGKEGLFYGLTLFFVLVNVMVYVVGKFYARAEMFRAWFHGLVITINVFFIVAVNFIGLYNSGEAYDFERIPYFIYGSIGAMILWAVAWPVYLIYQKFFLKQAV